jgi:hypothetical protein
MATTLLDLMDELLQSLEERDAGDPDAPAWDASARIQALEAELSRRLAAGETELDSRHPSGRLSQPSDEVLAGI